VPYRTIWLFDSIKISYFQAATIWKSGVCSYFSVEGEIIAGKGLIARDKTGMCFVIIATLIYIICY